MRANSFYTRYLGSRLLAIFGFLVTLAASAVFLGTGRPARAFPMFARKYDLPCARCHSMVPRLTPFGYAFYRAGFRLPGNEKRAYKLTNMTDVLTEVDAQRTRVRDGADISLPEVDGIFATSIEKNWAILAEYAAFNSSDEQSGFQDLWLQYNSAARGKFFSVRVGQIPVLDGYQLLGGRSITITDPMLFGGNGPLGAIGNENVGDFSIGGLERGVQVGYNDNAFHTRLSWLQGVDESGEGGIALQGNRWNDYVLQSEYLIGSEGSALGGFYYNGRTPLEALGFTDNVQRVGLFGTYSRYAGKISGGIPAFQWELNGGLLWGQDTLSADGHTASSYGALLEAALYLNHRSAFAARYDSVRPSSESGTPVTEAYTFALQHRASNYLQIGIEYRMQHHPNDDSLLGAFRLTL